MGVESRPRESKALAAAILDAALDPIVAIDHRGRIVAFNPAAERTFGHSAEEAIGAEMVDLIVSPRDREDYRRELESWLAKGVAAPPVPVELVAMRRDGSTLPVEVTVARVPDLDPPVFAGYIRDVTDRRRSEDRALKQSRAIADLAQARGELVSQLMLAEERTRQRIAQVLHDDALQRLLAAHQDLLESPGPEGAKRAQGALEGTIERIREAVAALHPVTHQQGDLETALGAVVRQQATHGGFRYTVRVEPEASGVEDQLVLSAASELVTNVAKHAQASRCAVSVERRGDRIRLEVADDGRGIPAGRQEEALRQGHIGLASTVQRMQAIGGDGEVMSTPGKGTVIRASIPVGGRASPAHG
jgi:PAS domain S-box-containing protein